MENKVKKCRVIFYVKTDIEVEQLFLCGELRSSGEWLAERATPLKPTPQGWRAIKYLSVGQSFSFKILRNKCWHGVEKGYWNEEINNHCIVAEKGMVVDIYIPTFRED